MAQGTLPHCTVKPLLSGHVLAHIQNNSEQDNRALYDVGNVAGDAQEGHAGDNQLLMNTPRTTPEILPVPPTNDTPPITAAEMASAS